MTRSWQKQLGRASNEVSICLVKIHDTTIYGWWISITDTDCQCNDFHITRVIGGTPNRRSRWLMRDKINYVPHLCSITNDVNLCNHKSTLRILSSTIAGWPTKQTSLMTLGMNIACRESLSFHPLSASILRPTFFIKTNLPISTTSPSLSACNSRRKHVIMTVTASMRSNAHKRGNQLFTLGKISGILENMLVIILNGK